LEITAITPRRRLNILIRVYPLHRARKDHALGRFVWSAPA